MYNTLLIHGYALAHTSVKEEQLLKRNGHISNVTINVTYRITVDHVLVYSLYFSSDEGDYNNKLPQKLPLLVASTPVWKICMFSLPELSLVFVSTLCDHCSYFLPHEGASSNKLATEATIRSTIYTRVGHVQIVHPSDLSYKMRVPEATMFLQNIPLDTPSTPVIPCGTCTPVLV